VLDLCDREALTAGGLGVVLAQEIHDVVADALDEWGGYCK
jgi:hypothetical protein